MQEGFVGDIRFLRLFDASTDVLGEALELNDRLHARNPSKRLHGSASEVFQRAMTG
jgi:hypothetical protein